MASKRKITSTTNELRYSNSESDGSDIDLIIKRDERNISGYHDSENSQVSSSKISLTFTKTISNEVHEQSDSFHFNEKSGIQCCFSSETKAIEYFKHFFDSSFWTLIVEEMNRYANEVL